MNLSVVDGRLFCLLLGSGCLLLLSGCATDASQSNKHMSVLAAGGLQTTTRAARIRNIGEAMGGGASCTSNADDERNLMVDYSRTLAACNYVLTRFEGDSVDAKKQKRMLMIVGAVAGSVIVPGLAAKEAASKSAIAAWGGLSGVTNVASHSMETEGLDAAYYLGTREKVRVRLDAAISKFTSVEADFCQRRSAVAEMAAACTSYAIQTPGAKPEDDSDDGVTPPAPAASGSGQ